MFEYIDIKYIQLTIVYNDTLLDSKTFKSLILSLQRLFFQYSKPRELSYRAYVILVCLHYLPYEYDSSASEAFKKKKNDLFNPKANV